MANDEVHVGYGKEKSSGRDVNVFKDDCDGGKLLVRDAKTAAVLARGAAGLTELNGYDIKLNKPEEAAA